MEKFKNSNKEGESKIEKDKELKRSEILKELEQDLNKTGEYKDLMEKEEVEEVKQVEPEKPKKSNLDKWIIWIGLGGAVVGLLLLFLFSKKKGNRAEENVQPPVTQQQFESVYDRLGLPPEF